MGTSKGYIPPTKPEWSNAKRAISSFLRNRDADSRVNAIQKFGEAMSSGAAVGTKIGRALHHLPTLLVIFWGLPMILDSRA